MRQAIVQIRTSWSPAIPEDVDPEIKEVLADPLGREEIARLAAWGEKPERADPNIVFLPTRKSNLRIENTFLQKRRANSIGRVNHALTAFGDWKVPERWPG
jgi:hypothetical protein